MSPPPTSWFAIGVEDVNPNTSWLNKLTVFSYRTKLGEMKDLSWCFYKNNWQSCNEIMPDRADTLPHFISKVLQIWFLATDPALLMRIAVPLGMQGFASLHEERNSIPASIVNEESCCSKGRGQAVIGHCLVFCVTRILDATTGMTFVLAYYHIFAT